MLNMTDKSKKFLQKHLPEMLESDNLGEVLMSVYDFIDRHGFVFNEKTNDYDYTPLGIAAQEVYDDLYYSN